MFLNEERCLQWDILQRTAEIVMEREENDVTYSFGFVGYKAVVVFETWIAVVLLLSLVKKLGQKSSLPSLEPCCEMVATESRLTGCSTPNSQPTSAKFDA